uniref:Uncharacterized protein n=1 Tax=Peromyscus maniculatus bairdii TaxID=230844 RepID=A0A8C8UGH2_PERMB
MSIFSCLAPSRQGLSLKLELGWWLASPNGPSVSTHHRRPIHSLNHLPSVYIYFCTYQTEPIQEMEISQSHIILDSQ